MRSRPGMISSRKSLILLLAFVSFGAAHVKFTSEELRCLVCKAVSEEIDSYIFGIDPRKMTQTGNFRINADGKQSRKLIPYARSQESLMEMTETLCKRFDEYAQAIEKKSGRPAVIALTTSSGNMNPRFSDYDVIPDEELSGQLPYHCQSVVEDLEDEIMKLYAVEGAKNLGATLCSVKSNICPREFFRDEF